MQHRRGKRLYSTLRKYDFEALADFRCALRHFLRFSEEAAHLGGLTPQQHQAMLAIRGFPGAGAVTVGQLADRLQVRHHSVVGLVDRLHAKRLVKRLAVQKDRRQVSVALTTLGSRKLESLSRAHRDELRRVGPHLTQLLKKLGEANR